MAQFEKGELTLLQKAEECPRTNVTVHLACWLWVLPKPAETKTSTTARVEWYHEPPAVTYLPSLHPRTTTGSGLSSHLHFTDEQTEVHSG